MTSYKIATAAYPLDILSSWTDYREKLTDWVENAVDAGASLLVFPEYGAMELASLAGMEVAADLDASLFAVAERLERADAIHSGLAREFGVHILAATGPATNDTPEGTTRPVNRARFFAPDGACVVQDKQTMTRFEAETWNVIPGEGLNLYETKLGIIGILTCYDCEFPELGHALAEADVLLVPSATDTLAGYNRVRIGAQARALENQCVTVMSSVVGDATWLPAMDRNVGTGGVFGPPDLGFPDDGVLACGQMNEPGWSFADVDLARIHSVRRHGAVHNRRDRLAGSGRTLEATFTSLLTVEA